MSEITKKQWLRDGNLLYRLHNGVNFDEIRVIMVNGVYDVNDRDAAINETASLKKVLESHAELYEALDRLAGVLEPAVPDFTESEEGAFDQAINALAKARGEQQ